MLKFIKRQKFQWQHVAPDVVAEPEPAPTTNNPDLLIRNLLDDPRLRAAMTPRPTLPWPPPLPVRVPGEALLALRNATQERTAA